LTNTILLVSNIYWRVIIIKKALPIILLIAVLAAAYFFFGKSGGSKTGEPQTFSSLKTAVGLGVPMKCTYTVEGAQYEGFIKGEMWRGKISSQEGVTEVILKDNCMWTWTDADKAGVTTCFEAEDAEGSSEESNDVWSQQGEAAGVEYNCSPALVPDNTFDPPTDINFTDFNSLLDDLNIPDY